MLEASNVYLPLDAALPSCAGMAQAELAHALGIRYADITSWKFSKLSVDARRKNDVHFTASFVFEVADQEIEEALAGKRTKTKIQVKRHVPYEGYRVGEWLGGDARPIVVGMGPAGLFAAWALAKSGAAPIVLERGEDVDARMASVNSFKEGGALNPESNVQFGEGGAGTFSDGKLTTNIKNPRCRDVLHIFAQAGAPEEILWEGKPHIGTDKLVNVVKTMREQIIAWGGEVRFGARFEGMEFEDGLIVAVRAPSAKKTERVRNSFCRQAMWFSRAAIRRATCSTAYAMQACSWNASRLRWACESSIPRSSSIRRNTAMRRAIRRLARPTTKWRCICATTAACTRSACARAAR